MLRKTRIAVFVSGGGTNLQALLNAQDAGKLPDGEIVLVLSNQKDAYALTRAQNHGVKTATIVKKECTDQRDFEEKIIKTLQENEIDMIVLVGFMAILSEFFTSQYANRILNVHPSLIPSFCGKGFYGLRVHEAALAYGVKVTGATVHFVNEIPDGGKIILQKSVKIQKNDTPESLQKRVMEQAEWKLLPRAVQLVSRQIRTKKL
jgi:phosphoribosylglycinamide formyltransferase-1